MNAATMAALGYLETTERPEPVPMTGYVPTQSAMPDYSCKTYGVYDTCKTMRVYDHKTMMAYDGVNTERGLEEYKENVYVEDEQPEAQIVEQIKAQLEQNCARYQEIEKTEDERTIGEINHTLFVAALIVLGFIADYRFTSWLFSWLGW